MPLEKAKKRYFLKGSSGSGKSTFIKKIAAEFESAGFSTERFHCANDPDSLDAMSVSNQGICIIDATSPHACDPEIPVAVDEIIDFTKFIDEKKIIRHVDEISSLLRAKKPLAKKAQGYFAAAGSIYLAERAACEIALNRHSLRKLAKEWISLFDTSEMTNHAGINRKLFLSAVTPDGFISFADSSFSGCKVCAAHAESGIGTDIFLSELRDESNANGINTESFYCPFAPDILEYLHLPEMNTVFAAVGSRFGYSGNVDEKINIDRYIDTSILRSIKPDIEQGNELFDRTLDATIDIMKTSRVLHNKIESLYASAIDFEKINSLTEKMIQEILIPYDSAFSKEI